MKRLLVEPREDWQNKVSNQGFYWAFTEEGMYWDESAAYEFTEDEIDTLYAATEELQKMCLHAVEHVIENNLFWQLGINPKAREKIIDSWKKRQPHLYGRFDFLFDGTNFKMLEYNADTPTILLESSVIQWHWKTEVRGSDDQFNSLEEDIIRRWKVIDQYYQANKYHFTCAGDTDEDYSTVHYLMDCLKDLFPMGDSKVQFVSIDDIGWNEETKKFEDLHGNEITHLFKLYPYEWLVEEEFADKLLESNVQLIEPWWKMILSNKAILPILWELYPDHPNLLPSYYTKDKLEGKDYVVKPFYSREGAEIQIISSSHGEHKGPERGYDKTQCIYQELVQPFRFEDKIPLLGAWVIGDKAAGLGIREDSAMITSNFSRFIPHYFANRK